MKIKEITRQLPGDDDPRDGLTILIDGEIAFDFLDGEPEDATIRRDFSNVRRIVKALQQAHADGASGQPLEIERERIIETDDE